MSDEHDDLTGSPPASPHGRDAASKSSPRKERFDELCERLKAHDDDLTERHAKYAHVMGTEAGDLTVHTTETAAHGPGYGAEWVPMASYDLDTGERVETREPVETTPGGIEILEDPLRSEPRPENPYRTVHARMSPPGAAWDEGFAAGRAAATPDPPDDDKRVRVTCFDPVTGESGTQPLDPDNYLLTLGERCEITACQVYANGTVQLTIKRGAT